MKEPDKPKDDEILAVLTRLLAAEYVVAKANEEETVLFSGAGRDIDPVVCADVVAIVLVGLVMLPLIGLMGMGCGRVMVEEAVLSGLVDAEVVTLPLEVELSIRELLVWTGAVTFDSGVSFFGTLG